MTRERGELVGSPEPRRKRHLLAERSARRLGEAREHRSVEDPRGDRDDANADTGELARDRESHPRDPRLRRGIGGLSNLPVERCDRRGADDDAALAPGVWRVLRHRRGREAEHVERPYEVDLNDLREEVERERPLLPEDAAGRPDSGAEHGDRQRAERAGGRDRARDRRLVGDVGLDERRAERGGGALSVLARAIEEDDPRAALEERARGRLAETGGTTRDERDFSSNVHPPSISARRSGENRLEVRLSS